VPVPDLFVPCSSYLNDLLDFEHSTNTRNIRADQFQRAGYVNEAPDRI